MGVSLVYLGKAVYLNKPVKYDSLVAASFAVAISQLRHSYLERQVG